MAQEQGGRVGSAPRKLCRGCAEFKSVVEFHRNKNKKDGRVSRCKDCQNPQGAAERARRREREYLARRGLKRCGECGEIKNTEDFHRRSSQPDGLHNSCKDCKSAKDRQYRDRPEVRQRSQERVRQWYEDNRDRVRHNHRNWSEQNRERIRCQQRERRKLYPETYRAIAAASLTNYRARKLSAVGEFTALQWKALCEFYGFSCLCCGVQGKLEADHVVPLSKGGANNIDNLQPLCRSCNASKGARTVDYRDLARHAEFLQSL